MIQNKHIVLKCYASIMFFRRYGNFEDFLNRMDQVEGGIMEMAKGYNYFGCHVEPDKTFVCRQWAPGAKEMWLMGDFNDWRYGLSILENLLLIMVLAITLVNI